MFGMALGAYSGGAVYEMTHSYLLVFLIQGILELLEMTNNPTEQEEYTSMISSVVQKAGKLTKNQLAKVGFYITGDYWVIDRMSNWDRPNTIISIIICLIFSYHEL